MTSYWWSSSCSSRGSLGSSLSTILVTECVERATEMYQGMKTIVTFCGFEDELKMKVEVNEGYWVMSLLVGSKMS